MARYGLIMRDEVFMILMQKAMSEGKSFGKYVNEVLNEHAYSLEDTEEEDEEATENTVRCKHYIDEQGTDCGRPAKFGIVYQNFLDEVFPVCGRHYRERLHNSEIKKYITKHGKLESFQDMKVKQ